MHHIVSQISHQFRCQIRPDSCCP